MKAATEISKMIAADGEGATKFLQCTVFTSANKGAC